MTKTAPPRDVRRAPNTPSPRLPNCKHSPDVPRPASVGRNTIVVRGSPDPVVAPAASIGCPRARGPCLSRARGVLPCKRVRPPAQGRVACPAAGPTGRPTSRGRRSPRRRTGRPRLALGPARRTGRPRWDGNGRSIRARGRQVSPRWPPVTCSPTERMTDDRLSSRTMRWSVAAATATDVRRRGRRRQGDASRRRHSHDAYRRYARPRRS